MQLFLLFFKSKKISVGNILIETLEQLFYIALKAFLRVKSHLSNVAYNLILTLKRVFTIFES
jgi:hypothetical protein